MRIGQFARRTIRAVDFGPPPWFLDGRSASWPQRTRDRSARFQTGVALLLVLLILLTVAGSATSFIWYMNQAQSRAGLRYRSAAALAVAEAGIYSALSLLERQHSEDEAGLRNWRLAAHTETIPVGPQEGRFAVDLASESDGAILVTSVGEVGGISRRLRARVYLASPALLAALYGAGYLRLGEPPAALFIVPYGIGQRDHPWVHIAAGGGVAFASANVSLNDTSSVFEVAPGPVDGPDSANALRRLPPPAPARILLARGGELSLHRQGQPVDVQQLRAMGVPVEGVLPQPDRPPQVPEVDAGYYAALAASNTANASLNREAGRYVGNADLVGKSDSLYSPGEFDQVQLYLLARRGVGLRGVVYVRGALLLAEGEELHIADGALVLEGAAYLSQGASLEITHTAASRRLPGLVLLGEGALVVEQYARARIHGLVYANRTIAINEGSRVEVVGAMLGNDARVSANLAGALIIRYDPAVLGTPGLRAPAGTQVMAWVAAWEELP